MPKCSKTLLEKVILSNEELTLPERTRYSVIANRLVAMGGFKSNDIYAKRFNESDYLIINNKNINDNEVPLAIVNENNSEAVVLDRLYKEALKVANERARFDNNKVLDLTGNMEIPEEARYYR